MPTEYTVSIEGMEKVLARFPDEARRRRIMKWMLTAQADSVIAEAKKEAPARTGNLRNSIVKQVSDTEATVFPTANYAEWVEKGTGLFGPHHQRIYPKTAKAMAWPASASLGGRAKAGSSMIFATSTKGMKPNPFMERAAEKAKATLPVILEKASAFPWTPGAPV